MIQSVCVFVSSAAVSDFLSELLLYYLTSFKLGHWAKGRGGEEQRPTGTHKNTDAVHCVHTVIKTGTAFHEIYHSGLTENVWTKCTVMFTFSIHYHC